MNHARASSGGHGISGKLRVLVMSWRDLDHPESGGAEVFAERTSAVLAQAGHQVTIFSSHVDGQPGRVERDGFRIIRRGSRFSVYPRGLVYLWRRRHRFDVVVDVQNGVPFWSPIVFRGPVLLLVHHVHRAQWFTFFPWPVARIGWWLESRVSPRVYRSAAYTTVSQASRDEISELGIDPARIEVVYSGNEAPAAVVSADHLAEPDGPHVVVLGRLVPHKRFELAMDAVASLRDRIAGIRLTVIGGGDWTEALFDHARNLGVDDIVHFTGVVDDDTKHRILDTAAVMAMPSVKEGWGLTIVEAGYHGVPSVAFRYAGGTRESIIDNRTGVLVDTDEEFIAAIEQLLTDETLRRRLGAEAQRFARSFTWARTGEEFTALVEKTALVKKTGSE